MATSAVAYARSQLGAAYRSGDIDRIDEARTAYNRAAIDVRIADIIDRADALTSNQRAQLADLSAI